MALATSSARFLNSFRIACSFLFLRDPRVKRSADDIAKALEGDYRQEHLFALKQAVDAYEFYHRQMEECDEKIKAYQQSFKPKVDPALHPLKKAKGAKKKVQGNQPRFDLRENLYRITGVDFTQIAGLNVMTIQTIITEIGLDPSAFPTAKHFASWLGLCPANKITGGRVKSSRTRKVTNRAATAFRLAAMSVSRSDSFLGAFYRRKRAQLGAPKAITATAHKMTVQFYSLWKNGGAYKDPGQDYYEQKYRDRTIKNMKNTAAKLGLELTLTPVVSPETQAAVGM
ncbi:MAG: IS110 family transposase [Deltaproteobacteria bacterium]|nr:IS110 family transposase [Deltaproteobacteria bacterium]